MGVHVCMGKCLHTNVHVLCVCMYARTFVYVHRLGVHALHVFLCLSVHVICSCSSAYAHTCIRRPAMCMRMCMCTGVHVRPIRVHFR